MKVQVSQEVFEREFKKLKIVPNAQDILIQLQMSGGSPIHHVDGAKAHLEYLLNLNKRDKLKSRTFRELEDEGIDELNHMYQKLYQTFVAGCYKINLDI